LLPGTAPSRHLKEVATGRLRPQRGCLQWWSRGAGGAQVARRRRRGVIQSTDRWQGHGAGRRSPLGRSSTAYPISLI